MKPSPLTYHRPGSIDEACTVLAQVAHEGKVLAGGQSLIPLLSMRLAGACALVDIGALPDLDAVTASEQSGVRFGALTRHSALEADPAAARVQPLLGRALRLVAHPTIRNRGTTVGSIVHADPSAEMPAVVALLGGTVTARSVRGTREIPAAELFVGPLESALEPDEIATSVTVPPVRPGVGTAIDEIARRHGDYRARRGGRAGPRRGRCRHVGPHDVRVRGRTRRRSSTTPTFSAARPRATPGIRCGRRCPRRRARRSRPRPTSTPRPGTARSWLPP